MRKLHDGRDMVLRTSLTVRSEVPEASTSFGAAVTDGLVKKTSSSCLASPRTQLPTVKSEDHRALHRVLRSHAVMAERFPWEGKTWGQQGSDSERLEQQKSWAHAQTNYHTHTLVPGGLETQALVRYCMRYRNRTRHISCRRRRIRLP